MEDLFHGARALLSNEGIVHRRDLTRWVIKQKPTLTTGEAQKEAQGILDALLLNPRYKMTHEGSVVDTKSAHLPGFSRN